MPFPVVRLWPRILTNMKGTKRDKDRSFGSQKAYDWLLTARPLLTIVPQRWTLTFNSIPFQRQQYNRCCMICTSMVLNLCVFSSYARWYLRWALIYQAMTKSLSMRLTRLFRWDGWDLYSLRSRIGWLRLHWRCADSNVSSHKNFAISQSSSQFHCVIAPARIASGIASETSVNGVGQLSQ